MVFTEGEISLEASPRIPKYFSTTLTNEMGVHTHLHCLITYECISPCIIHNSKDRYSSLSALNIIKTPEVCDENNNDSTSHHGNMNSYVPIALCLMTTSSYIDVFREILECLYSFLIDIRMSDVKGNSVVASIEFMRTVCLLINDVVLPPYDIELRIKIGGNEICVPAEPSSGLPHLEKCIAVLLDLIDIRNIIEVWESMMLNKPVFLMSCNEYLLYLILEAFKELLFPLKWTLYIVPVLGPKLTEYLAAPVPILIGLNSTQITIQEALKFNPTAHILDIDSNLLYNSSHSLCDCQRASISKKLQLVKAYYYVNRERLSAYRMNSLENNIEDEELVKTAKSMLTAESHEREKIFISLVRHIFLSFFITGLDRFNKYFTYDSFKEKFNFDSEKFLTTIKKCKSCKMEEFWKVFTHAITFEQFLLFEGKYDDSYYKRYFDILKSLEEGNYHIYEAKEHFRFEIGKALSPRQLLELVRNERNTEIKAFVQDSIDYLRLEVRNELRIYRDYYKFGEEGIRKYKTRKVSFTLISSTMSNKSLNCFSLYYGRGGIIRLSTLLLAHVPLLSFGQFSTLQDNIFPRLDWENNPDCKWEILLIKLNYLVKDKVEYWNAKEIFQILKELNKNEDILVQLSQLVTGIIDQIIRGKKYMIEECVAIGGKIGNLAKMISRQSFSPLGRAKSEFFDSEPKENFSERTQLLKLNTTINENDSRTEFKRKHTRKKTFHKKKSYEQ